MNLEPETLLGALADATRLRIAHLLTHHDELCVCEIVGALDLPQPKVSKHLAVLRRNELIAGRRRGQWIHYRMNPELPAWAGNLLQDLSLGCASRLPYRDDLARVEEKARLSNCA